MNIFHAIILGIVQGLTEFLPISSTAHLTLSGKLMGLISETNPESWTAFMAVVQLGTIAAVLIYFRNDLVRIVVSFVKDNILQPKKFNLQQFESRLGWLIVIGSVPVVVIGMAFKKVIEGNLTKNLFVISGSLILLAIVLAVAEKTAKLKKEILDITIKDAIIIGFAQSLALIPGSSRSGTTITGALFTGLNREAAARFSFLLSIPAILGSGLLELLHVIKDKSVQSSDMLSIAIATVVAFVSGYVAIDLLLKFLKKNTTFVFIYYRIALGLLILSLLFTNYIKP